MSTKSLLCQSLLSALVVLGALAVSQLHAADDPPLPVGEFNAAKAQWADWLDKPLRVEGRVTSVSKHQFKFMHCDLMFHVTEDQSRRVGNARNVQVAGKIKREKDSGKLYFAVDRVEVAPSDLEQFDLRELKLKSIKPADWYALANWAAGRSAFYDDEDLAARSRRAWRKGFDLERAGLDDADFDARLALADKLKERETDPELQAELRHEAAAIHWKQSEKNRRQIETFADWLLETYPESAKPLKTWPVELAKNYEANPLDTFRAATADERKLIPRLLMVEAELAQILPLAKADGSNAATIADALKQRVSERSDLIEKYGDTAFQHRLAAVAKARRSEALQLANELKSRDRADDAKKLLQSWLTAQEPRMRDDGPIGLLQLADDYLRMLNDEPAAVKLLAEAHKLDPSLEDAGDRLKELGYNFDGTQWTKGDIPAPETTSPEKAHSQLAIGMSAEEVLSLLGSPAGKTRVITRNGVQEVWAFGRRGTSRLLIHLERPSTESAAKVKRFLTEK
jgi:hypothetical protein